MRPSSLASLLMALACASSVVTTPVRAAEVEMEAAEVEVDAGELEGKATELERQASEREEGAAQDGSPLLEQPPYAYPTAAGEPAPYPESPWSHPAAAADLLLVRPAMVAGLAGGAVLFVAMLPFTLATFTLDDATQALADQARSAFVRPLGAF
jgi:hypothetical protein